MNKHRAQEQIIGLIANGHEADALEVKNAAALTAQEYSDAYTTGAQLYAIAHPQDIVMGYSTTTGEPITLREHEATFAEYIGHGRAAAWRKTNQVGFYRALQEDWEAARDDDIDPPLVDTVADLEPYTIRIAQYRASKI